MNRLVCSVVAAFAVWFAFGEAQNPAIVRVGGKGRVAFVNACDAPTGELEAMLPQVAKILQIDLGVQRGNWSLPTAQKDFEDAKASIAIFIARDKSLPMSLIAMESKWGFVNAEGLDAKCVKKEAMRVALVLLGSAASRFPASMMRPVFSREDLATKAGELLTFDSVLPLENYMPALGIEPYRLLAREDAIAEGLLKDDKAEPKK